MTTVHIPVHILDASHSDSEWANALCAAIAEVTKAHVSITVDKGALGCHTVASYGNRAPRDELRAKGEHPVPCARFCEIELRQLRAQVKADELAFGLLARITGVPDHRVDGTWEHLMNRLRSLASEHDENT